MAIKKENTYVKTVLSKNENECLKELVSQLGYSSVSKYVKDLILKDMKSHNIFIEK